MRVNLFMTLGRKMVVDGVNFMNMLAYCILIDFLNPKWYKI